MVYLTILKPDGSVYWKETFRTRSEADKWVDNEKKKPYWIQDFSITLDDKTAEEAIEDERRKTEAEAVQQKFRQALDNLKAARAKPNKTLPDVIQMVDLIADFLTGEHLK